MKGIIIAAAVFCVALIGGGVFLATRTTSSAVRLMPLDAAYTQRVQQGYWVRGNTTNPKVTLTEYGDFQCPGCAAMFPLIEQVVKNNGDILKFEWHTYPLPQHNKGKAAAIAAEAAGRQGKFWDMHQLLYANQTSWTDQLTSTFRNTVIEYAKALQLNQDQFKQDLDDASIMDAVNKDVELGNKIPLSATPTLEINGKVLATLPSTVEQLTQLIQDAAKTATAQP